MTYLLTKNKKEDTGKEIKKKEIYFWMRYSRERTLGKIAIFRNVNTSFNTIYKGRILSKNL